MKSEKVLLISLFIIKSYTREIKSDKNSIKEEDDGTTNEEIILAESLEDICLNGTVFDKHNDNHRTSLMWNDDHCNEFKCVFVNGRYSIEVTSCGTPVPPINAIECHLHNSEEKETMYPYCCKKLRCIVLINGEKYVHIVGQLGETISNELYKNCTHEDESHENHNHTELLNKFYPLASAEVSGDTPLTDDEATSPPNESEAKLEHDSIFKWLFRPLEAIFASESEIFKIVKTRNEIYYDYFNKLWWS